MKVLSVPPGDGVVLLTAVVELEILLYPLAHFGVVEETALGQLIDVQVLLNSVFPEGIVEDLVVFNIFVVELCSPLDAGEVESARVDFVNDLAVHRASS